MAQGIGEVLTFAVGVAISPVPIIAVILMLFSGRAKVNGPMFLAGWVVALAVVSGAAYLLSDAGNASTDSAAADGVSWAQIVFGVLFLLLAGRSWRNRPAPGTEPQMPKWMAGIDAFAPAKALGLGLLLAGVNPKNLLLAAGAGSALAVTGPSTAEAAVSLIVFVAVGSLTIAGPCRLLPHRRRSREDAARLGEGMAVRAQRCRDDGAVPRPRREPHRQGHPATDLITKP